MLDPFKECASSYLTLSNSNKCIIAGVGIVKNNVQWGVAHFRWCGICPKVEKKYNIHYPTRFQRLSDISRR